MQFDNNNINTYGNKRICTNLTNIKMNGNYETMVSFKNLPPFKQLRKEGRKWNTIKKYSPVLERLILDIDNKSLENALKNTREIMQNELRDYAPCINIYFSGNKGFHVEIQTEELDIINIRAESAGDSCIPYKEFLNYFHNKYSDVDTKIHDAGARIIRKPNTKHEKSGNYKILVDVNASLEEILDYAKQNKDMVEPCKLHLTKEQARNLLDIYNLPVETGTNIKELPITPISNALYSDVFNNFINAGYGRHETIGLLGASLNGYLTLEELEAVYQELVQYTSIEDSINSHDSLIDAFNKDQVPCNMGQLFNAYKNNTKIDHDLLTALSNVLEDKISFCNGMYKNRPNLCYIKKYKDGKILEIPISRFGLEYFKLISDGQNTDRIAIKFKGEREIIDYILSIDNLLKKEGYLTKKGNYAKDFIGTIVTMPDIEIETRLLGGYFRLEDLPTTKPKYTISQTLQEFLNALNNTQAYALKQLWLYGFVNIIRQKAINPRELVKALVECGARLSAKTLLVNFARNMYTTNRVGFLDGGSPQSPIALRNMLANDTGIVLCDESDGKLVNKKRRTLYNDVENMVKGIYQMELPKTSDLNNQGTILNQIQKGVPVFTFNDTLNLTEALSDRLIVVQFDNCERLPILDLNEIKPELLLLGECVAYVFGKSWDKLKKCTNNDELVNMLLTEIISYYPSLDLSNMINATNNPINSMQKITDCTHEYLIHKLGRFMNDDRDIPYVFINYFKASGINWIADVNEDGETILHQKKFNDFVKSNDCLNDGGISSIKISERLYNETGIKPVKKLKRINGKRYNVLIYQTDDFLTMFDLW